jgi:hypothetical protein
MTDQELIIRLVDYVNRITAGDDVAAELKEDMQRWGFWDQVGDPIQDDINDDPEFTTGDRVVFLPGNILGTVVQQLRHHDGAEEFWGNVLVELDNHDKKIICNNWQLKKANA